MFHCVQVDLFHATTEKKESIPKLRICDFLKHEVCVCGLCDK